MGASRAATVAEYLVELPPDRREVVAATRALVRRHLPKGYKETMNWGAITWEIPLAKYPETYNGQPLCYVALAGQKNYCALYLMGAYGNPKQHAWLKDQFQKAGKKFDMGKSCLRFRSLDDIPIEAVGQVIASTTPAEYISIYEKARKK